MQCTAHVTTRLAACVAQYPKFLDKNFKQHLIMFTSCQVSVIVEEGHFQRLLHNAVSYMRKSKAVKLSVRLGSVFDRNAGIK